MQQTEPFGIIAGYVGAMRRQHIAPSGDEAHGPGDQAIRKDEVNVANIHVAIRSLAQQVRHQQKGVDGKLEGVAAIHATTEGCHSRHRHAITHFAGRQTGETRGDDVHLMALMRERLRQAMTDAAAATSQRRELVA